MLNKFLSRLFQPKATQPKKAPQALVNEAATLRDAGNTRGALKVLRDLLEIEPTNVGFLNDYAACLSEIGDVKGATDVFELAYSLDDTFIPAMVNHARVLVDHKRMAEALPLLHRAKVSASEHLHTDGVYGSVLMAKGDTERAVRHALRSWCGNFESLRHANAFLFWASYQDRPETEIAAEHRFWAETLAPLPQAPVPWTPPEPPFDAHGRPTRRLRIGYWSPDFRSHSVRYFFEPLLAGHDRSRVELFLYHDFPFSDQHTDKVRALADHFHDANELADDKLHELIVGHGLDVLVELAGHTSHNRLSMLQRRMATVQMTGIGYPSSTGLPSIDYKFLDRHVLAADPQRFYAEAPLVLPTSFWCFDPMEPVPEPGEPPCLAAGHVTFGCVGNISKISAPVMAAWGRILQRVPGSRLLVRSVTFADPLSEVAMRERLEAAGLPMERVDLRKPEAGETFYRSYDEIDVMLDTFPFNGGTTTCLATYMGVPLVTLAGESLLTRMGASVMTNLGAPQLVVADLDAYVERAAAVATDHDFLRRFRAEVRERYASSALGNGRLFAAEFEDACEAAVKAGPPAWTPRIPALPAQELLRRAYTAAQRGHLGGATRILDHCLREYPTFGPGHLLRMQQMIWKGEFEAAGRYLEGHLPAMDAEDRLPALLALVRLDLLLGRRSEAAAHLDQAQAEPAAGVDFDRLQLRLYRHALSAGTASAAAALSAPAHRYHVIVPCDARADFDRWRVSFEQACPVPAGSSLRIECCDEAERVAAYRQALEAPDADIVLLMQKHTRFASPDFLPRLAAALEQADVVGIAGASRWGRLDWRYDDFACKAGGLILPSTEHQDQFELHVLGTGMEMLVPGMAVLDGTVLAVRASAVGQAGFDEELLGAATLLEEAWAHQAFRAGARLAAHRALGVFTDAGVELDTRNATEAKLAWTAAMGFDPFAAGPEDAAALSVPVASPQEAYRIACAYHEPQA